jgi:uncharacterized Fe-S cluster-containing MiaB family protein
MPRIKDLQGKKFGRLTAIAIVGAYRGQVLWNCFCECGNYKDVPSGRLIKGATRSCGCLAKESHSISARKEPGHAAKTLAYQEYKKGAKRRNILFLLTKEQFLNIVSGSCYYCGVLSSRVKIAPGNNGNFMFNGIDRLDNAKGYVLGNCVACCYQCNWAKLDVSKEDFLKWIDKVYHYAFG